MNKHVPYERLTRLRPVTDLHASALMMGLEAVEGDDPWARSVTAVLAPPEQAALRVMATSRMIPDVACGAPADPAALVTDLAANAPGSHPVWRPVLRAPERWLAAVASASVRLLPAAAATHRREQRALHAFARAVSSAAPPERAAGFLAGLHPRTRVGEQGWELPVPGGAQAVPDAGLAVIPVMTQPGRSLIGCDGDTVTTLLAGVAASYRDDLALEGLLGPVRAAVLRRLAVPHTMGELSEAMALANGAITHHVKALEQSGLAVRRRRGRFSVVRRTDRGTALLDLYGGAGTVSRDLRR